MQPHLFRLIAAGQHRAAHLLFHGLHLGRGQFLSIATDATGAEWFGDASVMRLRHDGLEARLSLSATSGVQLQCQIGFSLSEPKEAGDPSERRGGRDAQIFIAELDSVFDRQPAFGHQPRTNRHVPFECCDGRIKCSESHFERGADYVARVSHHMDEACCGQQLFQFRE